MKVVGLMCLLGILVVAGVTAFDPSAKCKILGVCEKSVTLSVTK